MHSPTAVETHASDTESLTVAVVSAVAESKGVSVADLPPLYDAVDIDAVGNLFDSTGTTTRASGTVSFRFADRSVDVHADGTVVASPLDIAPNAAAPTDARAD